MAYTLTLLTTAAECDAVLTQLQSRLRTLNQQASTLVFQQENAEESVADIDIALATATSEVDSLTLLVPTIANAQVKKRKQELLRQAESRQASLRYRRESRGGAAALLLELDYDQITAQIDQIRALAAAVTTHKATL